MELGFRMRTRDCAAMRTPDDTRKEIKRLIYLAYAVGNKVSFRLETLIDSGASLKVIKAVYRHPSER